MSLKFPVLILSIVCSIATSAYAAEISSDLLKTSENILNFSRSELTFENCSSRLSDVMKILNQKSPLDFDRESAQENASLIISNLWQSRLELKNQLTSFVSAGKIKRGATTDSCVNAIRKTSIGLRFLEDYLAENLYGVRNFNEKTDSKKSVPTFTGEVPWLVKAPSHKEVRFRSGDILISRGNAFTSAAIGRTYEIDTPFSHLTVIYVKDGKPGQTYSLDEVKKNSQIMALEAFIELGSSIRPLQTYLEDGNARNMLFRYHDADKAHAGAKFTYDFIVKKREQRYRLFGTWNPLDILHKKSHPNFNVPYDFQIDLQDHSELNCVETGSMGYASQGVNLPFFPSIFEDKEKNPMVAATNPKNRISFNPADMELDPRFETIAEWRDLRKLGGLRLKNALLASMFKWTRDLNYKFRPSTAHAGKAVIGTLLRDLDFKTKALPRNMPASMAELVLVLSETADILFQKISLEEDRYSAKTNGLKMTNAHLMEKFEEIRLKDLADFKAKNQQGESFHQNFRP